MKKLLFLLLVSSAVFYSCEETESPEVNDTTPPTVTITSPQNNSTVSEIVTITCMSSDNVGVEKVELWVDGTPTEVSDESEPYSLPFNTTTYQDSSSHMIIVRATDKVGNRTDSDPITLTIDNSNSWPDRVDIISISYTETEATIAWESSNAQDFLEYRILSSGAEDGIRTNIATITDIVDTLFVHNEITPDQQVWYWVEVVDQYGFETISEGRYIRVSTTLPDIIFRSSMGMSISSIYRTDFDGNNLRQLTTGMNIQRLSVPFDGSIIIFEGSYVGESGSQIFKLDPYGQNIIQLTDDGHNTTPVVSQNGAKIIFLSYRDQGSGELYIMNSDGTGQSRLTNDEEYNAPYDISYNGTKILYMSYTSGNRQIHIMNNDGSDDLQLSVFDEGYGYAPRFSPDATRFVFVQINPNRLHTMNIDGTDQTQLWTQGSPREAQYSPDGSKILYRADEELYLMNTNGTGGNTQITDNESEGLYPQFSEDGSHIAFQLHIDNAYEIIRTSSSGTETRQITSMGGHYPYFIPK
jgi:Tol biopolymer transport system component